MSVSVDTCAAPGSRAWLEAEGFQGWLTVGALRAAACESVPSEAGVYAIVRAATAPPEFMPRSNAPLWRGHDPTRPIDELKQRWVAGAEVVYLNVARGPGVRNLLKQRVKRMLRFGQGRVVGHWSGRFVWQLRDHAALRVAWRVADDPAQLAADLRAAFQSQFGAAPFANEDTEAKESDE